VVVEVAAADQLEGVDVLGELVGLRRGQNPDQDGDQGQSDLDGTVVVIVPQTTINAYISPSWATVSNGLRV
jgi:hypothetical protein